MFPVHKIRCYYHITLAGRADYIHYDKHLPASFPRESMGKFIESLLSCANTAAFHVSSVSLRILAGKHHTPTLGRGGRKGI